MLPNYFTRLYWRRCWEQEDILSWPRNPCSALMLLSQYPVQFFIMLIGVLFLFSSGAAFGSFFILCVGGLISQALGWPFIFYIFGESLLLELKCLHIPGPYVGMYITHIPPRREKKSLSSARWQRMRNRFFLIRSNNWLNTCFWLGKPMNKPEGLSIHVVPTLRNQWRLFCLQHLQ